MNYIDLINLDKGLGLIKDKEIKGANVAFLHALTFNQKEIVKGLETFNETKDQLIKDDSDITDEEIEKFKELLDTDSGVQIKYVSMDDVSKIDGITLEILVLLKGMIEED